MVLFTEPVFYCIDAPLFISADEKILLDTWKSRSHPEPLESTKRRVSGLKKPLHEYSFHQRLIHFPVRIFSLGSQLTLVPTYWYTHSTRYPIEGARKTPVIGFPLGGALQELTSMQLHNTKWVSPIDFQVMKALSLNL